MVVFDGVTLGTIKNIPPAIIHIDTDQKLKCVPQSARLFIPSHVQWKRVTEYLQNGLSITAFRELVKNIGPNPLTEYMESSSVEVENILNCNNNRVKDVLYYFTRNEPISGIFQFSILDQDELITIVKLSKGKLVRESEILNIFRKMFTLERGLLSLEPKMETHEDGIVLLSLNPTICSLLNWIMVKLEYLYSMPSRKILPFKSTDTDNFTYYFPAFKTKYK